MPANDSQPAAYALVTFGDPDPQPGLRVGDQILPLSSVDLDPDVDTSSVLGLLGSWAAVLPVLDEFVANLDPGDEGAYSLEDVTLYPPVRWPRAIFCAISNYDDHVREWTAGSGLPDKSTTQPHHFFKTPFHTLAGPQDAVHLPRPDAKLFNEIELAAIVGKPTRSATVDEAMDSVAGYAVFNDMSDYSQHGGDDFFSKRFGPANWLRVKSFTNSSVLGPNLVPANQVSDPYKLKLELFVNDELLQESSSVQMHYTIAEQIAYLSEQLTLLPGDVISTGSIRGIGAVRGIFLEPGDRVRATITGLGEQENLICPAPALVPLQ